MGGEGRFEARNGRLYLVGNPDGSIDPDDYENYEISGNILFTPSGGCFGSWQTGKTMLY